MLIRRATACNKKIATIPLCDGITSQPRLVFVFVEGRFLQVRVDSTSLGVGTEGALEQKNVIFRTLCDKSETFVEKSYSKGPDEPAKNVPMDHVVLPSTALLDTDAAPL